MTPFCDWLTTTRPPEVWEELRPQVQLWLDASGFCQDYYDETTGVWRSGEATVRNYTRHGVHVLSFSGKACAAFRMLGVWPALLATIGSAPHRVTMLHLTLELAEDGPAHVMRADARATRGEIRLTRKGIEPQDCRALLSADARGARTGSVYIGRKHADVQAVVYDKRHERECLGYILDEPLVRYELRMRSGVGAALHDAWNPGPLFWHYAGRSLLPRPDGVQAWAPHAEGFALPDRPEFTPAQLLDRKLDNSPDVDRLLDLAAACGPYGFDLLAKRLRRRFEAKLYGDGTDADSEAPQGPRPLGGRPSPSGIH